MAAANVPSAEAGFAGQNGKIAFASDASGADEIYTVEADGSGLTRLTYDGGSEPAWSADGTRIAFVRDGTVWVMNADGMEQHSSGQPGSNPAWSPGGTKIVTDGLFVMNADGSERTQLTPSGFAPAWSPDGSTILFARPVFGGCNPYIGWYGRIWAINPDGTGERQITDAFACGSTWNAESDPNWEPRRQADDPTAYPPMRYVMHRRRQTGEALEILSVGANVGHGLTAENPAHPAWSPDAAKIAFQNALLEDLMVYDLAARRATRVLSTPFIEHSPDWQPLPANTPSTHARPKSAGRVQVSLVPAYNRCLHLANREHGPPFAYPSCSPPRATSFRLMIGVGDGHPAAARSIGSVRLRVTPGVPGGADDTTGRLRFNITNVMRVSDLSEYTGELRGSIRVRVTDKDGEVSSTAQDLALAFTVPCVPTDSTLDASACSLATDLDAMLPGATREGTRAVWQLDQVRVHDGGPDEDADTEDGNSLFAVQGVFVP
jgi:dipeptidyl aminopeptidase/acylaminoacyl peptidase